MPRNKHILRMKKRIRKLARKHNKSQSRVRNMIVKSDTKRAHWERLDRG